MYNTLYDSIVGNPVLGHGRAGFYFGENGEHRLADISKEIGRVLVQLGKATIADPDSFTKEEVDKYYRVSANIERYNSRQPFDNH